MTFTDESVAPVKSRRSGATNFVLFLVGMSLLGYSIYQNRVQIRECFAGQIRYSFIFQAFLLHCLGVSIAFVRWFALVRILGIQMPFLDSLRLSFVGSLFNLIIPGAVSGDLVKAAYLLRMNIPKTRAISSMVIDRLMGLLGVFLLSAIAGLSAWSDSTPPVRRLTIIVLISTACIILFMALIFSGIIGRNSPKMAELNAMSAAYRGHLPAIFFWSFASIFVHLFNTIAFFRISQAILPGLKIGLIEHFQIVPLVFFSTAVPLPFGAIGFSENVSDQLFQNFGHTAGAVSMMGFRLLQYAFALMSLIVYLFNLKSMKRLTSEPSPE